jgi:hypothetical protein
LIGRVLADREIQFAYFSERMSRAWKPVKRVTITKSVGDRFLFQFHHKVDASRVLDEGPWLYDNFHIAMDRINPGVVPSFVSLNHIDFWVQVHGLPFGFIQPKVGQGIGSFLGTLKAYDGRNTIHSAYMRLRVAIDVTVPLKKEWRVRASNGAFVTVNFKYEKLGVFCHRCGLLGHTDKVCPELYELDSDDGVRNWGIYLRPAAQRVGTAATNRWLQDPIPATMSQGNNTASGGFDASNATAAGAAAVPNFNDRMLAFQIQITAIKHDMLAVQTAAKMKQGIGTGFSGKLHYLPSSSTCNSTSSLLSNQPVVLGLPAVPITHVGCDESHDDTDTGSELKKRKRMLNLQNATNTFAAEGELGNNVIGTDVSIGGM